MVPWWGLVLALIAGGVIGAIMLALAIMSKD